MSNKEKKSTAEIDYNIKSKDAKSRRNLIERDPEAPPAQNRGIGISYSEV